MIVLENIFVTFNVGTPLEKEALKGIDLTIGAGDFLTIIGGNGAGKSTLLNVLSGEVKVAKGKIKIQEKDVTGLSTEQRAKYVGRVFQDPMVGTCSELTIEENFALAYRRGERRGLWPALTKKLREYFREELAKLNLGLERRMRDPMASLSGGQRQAVSLLMATLHPSQILLLDEHTSALDPKMAERVMQLTQDLITKHGLTALMVTHSLHQALDFGNRTVLMQEGHIVRDLHGPERSSLTPNDLVQLFK